MQRTTLHWWVEVEGLVAATFAQCSGISLETEVHEYRAGGLNTHTLKFPGPTRHGNLVLKRGMTDSQALWEWYLQVVRLGQQWAHLRKSVTVLLYDTQSESVVQQWQFLMAYPVKWAGPEFRADQGAVAIETLELAHEGFEARAKAVSGGSAGSREKPVSGAGGKAPSPPAVPTPTPSPAPKPPSKPVPLTAPSASPAPRPKTDALGHSATYASATRKPSAAEVKEIADAIAAKKHQEAIDLTVKHYGVDTSNVKGGVKYDPTEPNYGTGAFDGTLKIGPAAMSSPSTLATTIVHETTHSNQAAALKKAAPTLKGWPSGADAVNYDEGQAYDAELGSADHTGLSGNAAEQKLATDRRDTHYGKLPDPKKKTFETGKYPP